MTRAASAMRERAYSRSRSMTWERTAERYLAVFERARRRHPLQADRTPERQCAPLSDHRSAAADATRPFSVDVR